MLHQQTWLLAGLYLQLAGLASAQAPANAALPYIVAAKDLLRTFAVDSADELALPDAPEDPAAFAVAVTAWREVVSKTAGERATFAQAARLADCDFGPGQDAFSCGYEDYVQGLWKLVELTAAHGHLALAERQPGAANAAARDAFTLLRHARHLARQPDRAAALYAGQAEVHALVLLQSVLHAEPGPDAKLLGRASAELTEHEAKRLGRSGARECMRAEQRRYLEATIGAAKAEPPGKAANQTEAKLLREFGDQFRARVLSHCDAWMACLDGAGDFDLQAALAAQAKRMAELRRGADPKQVWKDLPQQPPEVAVEELAKVVATMLLVDVAPVLKADHRALALLRECRARLEPKPAAVGDGK